MRGSNRHSDNHQRDPPEGHPYSRLAGVDEGAVVQGAVFASGIRVADKFRGSGTHQLSAESKHRRMLTEAYFQTFKALAVMDRHDLQTEILDRAQASCLACTGVVRRGQNDKKMSQHKTSRAGPRKDRRCSTRLDHFHMLRNRRGLHHHRRAPVPAASHSICVPMMGPQVAHVSNLRRMREAKSNPSISQDLLHPYSHSSASCLYVHCTVSQK